MQAILFELIVVLGFARLGGSIAQRLGQPRIVGELMVGFFIGKAFLDLIEVSVALDAFADVGIIFLMYLAGLHMKPVDLLDVSIPSFLVAIFGAFIPMFLGFQVTIWFGFHPIHALFVGVALSITAVAVKARILIEQGELETRAGRIGMGAAVLDDVIGLVFFSILSTMVAVGTLPDGIELLNILARVMFFFGFAMLAGFLLPPITRRLGDLGESPDNLLTFCLIISFSFAYIAEHFGVHPIIGAYVAGLLVNSIGMQGIDTRRLQEIVHPLAFGFLVPLFFVRIALEVEGSAIFQNFSFVIAIIAVAMFGKVVGCGIAARIAGSSWRESLIIGLGMNGRGAVELVIAELGRQLTSNPLPDIIFSTLVLMAFTTTILTPITLKIAMPWYREELMTFTEPEWRDSSEPVGRQGVVE